jgi:hypothetical protein
VPDAASRALAAAGALGPFSAVDVAPGRDWVTWSALVCEPGPLPRRVREVRQLLMTGPGSPAVSDRVAASLVHLGLIARLVSPVLGAALLTGLMPVAPPERVRLRLSGSNPLPMALTGPTVIPVDGPPALAEAFDGAWLQPIVGALTVAVHTRYRVSRKVLEGNVASAVAGALRAATDSRPDLEPGAAAVLDALLSGGSLIGRGGRRADGEFIRRSCCLLYQLPGAGFCGDCVLAGRVRHGSDGYGSGETAQAPVTPSDRGMPER